MGDFSDRVFAVVRRIPRGTVATYGQVACMIGHPRSARYVGYALRNNPEPGDVIPCHRVVFKDGQISDGFAFGGPDVQRSLLQAEGVPFADDMHVAIDACRWKPDMQGRGRPDDIDWVREMREDNDTE
jgi:methylated-DNA-protein-cysteine methyltransferase-like protein